MWGGFGNMKKDFVFVSDFDGTISHKDFYWYIIDNYLQEKGMEQYDRWRDEQIKDIEFLGYIFENIGRTEEEIIEDIKSMEIDAFLKEFVEYIKERKGDFVILSAGSSYYINIILEHLGIENVTVYSNKAVFKEKGLYFDIEPTDKFYSERYGLDKKKVVKHLKEQYDLVYYAGDSEPDFEPSLVSDVRFARGQLIPLFEQNGVEFYPFENFQRIKKIIEWREEGVH